MSTTRLCVCALLATAIASTCAAPALANGTSHPLDTLLETTQEFYGLNFEFVEFNGNIDPAQLSVIPGSFDGKSGFDLTGPLIVAAGNLDGGDPDEVVFGTLDFIVSTTSPNKLLNLADLELMNPFIDVHGDPPPLTDGPATIDDVAAEARILADLDGGGVALEAIVADQASGIPTLTDNMPSDWDAFPGMQTSVAMTLSFSLEAFAGPPGGDLTASDPKFETFIDAGALASVDAIRVSFSTIDVPTPAALPAGLLALGALAVRRRRHD